MNSMLFRNIGFRCTAWFHCVLLLGLAFANPDLAASPVLQPDYTLNFDVSKPHDRLVLILPGLGHTTKRAEYQAVSSYYQARGITPVFVDIDWQKNGLRQLDASARRIGLEIRQTFPNSQICLFGFSFGAAMAWSLSKTLPPEHVLLCSMSPLFAEDCQLQRFPFQQLQKWFFGQSQPQLLPIPVFPAKLIWLYGEHDSMAFNPAIIQNRQQLVPGSQTKIVANAGHGLNPAYLSAIQIIVSELP